MKVYLWFVLLLSAALMAACGGGGDDNVPTTADESVNLDPTPTPALPLEERITFTPGTLNNPFQMVFKPVETLDLRLDEMLNALEVTSFEPDDTLRDDLGLRDDLANLNAYLQAYFGVNIRTYEFETLQTVADLRAWLPERIGEEVSRSLFEVSGGLYVDLVFVDSHGEALTALCNSGSGIVSFVWLHGPSTIAADAQNCGQSFMQVLVAEESPVVQFAPAPALIADDSPAPEATVEAEATAEATPEATPEADDAPEPTATPAPVDLGELRTGDPGNLILNRELGTSDLAVLQTRAFCRLSIGDFYSWFVPSLILDIDDIQPDTILEYPNRLALVEAVADGTCAATGISRDQLARLREAPVDLDAVRIVETTSPLVYAVLSYPLEVETGVRLNLNDVFEELGADTEDGRYLKLLLGQDAIVPLEDDALDDVRDFLADTGYDFALLGE